MLFFALPTSRYAVGNEGGMAEASVAAMQRVRCSYPLPVDSDTVAAWDCERV